MAGAVSLECLQGPLRRHPTDALFPSSSQNAIFTGEQMLTTPCSGWDEDKAMLDRWGLRGLRAFEDEEGNKIDAAHVELEDDGSVRLNAEAEKLVDGKSASATA